MQFVFLNKRNPIKWFFGKNNFFYYINECKIYYRIFANAPFAKSICH